MIEHLKGVLKYRKPNGVIIDVGGVGYGADMPLADLCELPPVGSEVEVWAYTHVKEDILKLFGFLHYEDRRLFEILISVNGVGPRLALAILSALDVDAVRMGAEEGRHDLFELVPGIGKRMAEKICVDLKSKIKKLDATMPDDRKRRLQVDTQENSVVEDVRSALENLGYKAKDVSPIMKHLIENVEEPTDFATLMKEALVKMRGPATTRG